MAEAVKKLQQQPGSNILVEGSATLVQSLAAAGLVDEYRLLVHPYIVGSGKRFFKEGSAATQLKLVRSQTLAMDVVLQCYQPVQ